MLFAGLSGEEGGRAIAELQKLNVPYRITDGGRVILVPEADVGFARLQLAARGVPKQDGDQWALFDNESLGVSPFAEQVHYARAVETALAHTVRDVDGVVSATVKLALPKSWISCGCSEAECRGHDPAAARGATDLGADRWCGRARRRRRPRALPRQRHARRSERQGTEFRR